MEYKLLNFKNTTIKVPLETEQVIILEQLKVPNLFQESQLSDSKIEKIKRHYLKHGYLDKPIMIYNDVVIDGYVRYLVAKKLNLKYVPIIISETVPKKFTPYKITKFNYIPVTYNKRKNIEIEEYVYVDASHDDNTKKYCSAYIVIKDGKIIHKDTFISTHKSTLNNNFAEAVAILRAIKYAKETNKKICIRTDSRTVMEWLIDRYNKKRNVNIIEGIIKIMNNTKDLYILEKVKGHGKDAFNRYVDKLAKSELSSIITN